MNVKLLSGSLLAAALCTTAFADALNMKPGLWETSVSSPGGAAGMPGIPPEALARMTPEQRAQVEAVMKARGMGRAGQPTVTKSCVTKEQLENAMTFGQERSGCKANLVSASRSRQEIQMTCDRGEVKAKGKVVIESQDPEHYTGTMEIHAETDKAGPSGMTINNKFTGKWISSDCGDVKPHTTVVRE